MTPSPARPRPIGQVPFPSADFWHLAPRPAKSRVGFKEWSHFSVLGGDFDLLVNFSVMTESEGASPRSTPRLTLLVRAPDGHWDGDVEVFNRVDTTILPGLPDAVFGRNSARFIGPHYRVEAELSSRAVSAALDLHPMTQPVIANQSRLSDAESFSWMVVSHLRAEGELNVSARRYRITDAPAYHDRNWGCFMWGGNGQSFYRPKRSSRGAWSIRVFATCIAAQHGRSPCSCGAANFYAASSMGAICLYLIGACCGASEYCACRGLPLC
jgi:hypothetical protein